MDRFGFVFGHLDGGGEGQLTKDFFDVAQKFFDSHLTLDEIPEVHIVGGFLDSKGFSKDLSLQIITQLLISKRTFRLRTLCCYTLNDYLTVKSGDQLHMPIIRAVVFDIRTGTLLPASIQPEADGPLSVLRSFYTYSRSAKSHMNNILDPISHSIILKPFTIGEKTQKALMCLRYLSDEQLKQFSTTPEQETDHFYKRLRLTGHLFANLKKDGVDLFAQGSLEFIYKDNLKQWCPANEQTEDAVKYSLTYLK